MTNLSNSADNMPKLIVFDCDGTLVSSKNQIIQAMHYAWQQASLPKINAQEIQLVTGLPLPQALNILLAQQNIAMNDKELARLGQDFLAQCDQYLQKSEPKDLLFAGIDDLLKKLDQPHILLAAATGMGRSGLNQLLRKLRYESVFFATRSADDGPGKPAPDILLDLIVQASVTPQATMMIGDTSWDMQMAKNAKTLGVGVTWGNHSPESLLTSGADILVEDTNALYDKIIKFCNAG
ncbi:MAG: HAD-IA family hydrolase [Pseudomonadota bacterium]